MNLPIYFTFFMTFCTIPLIIFNHWPFWNSPIQWEDLTYFQYIPFWVTGREAVFQKKMLLILEGNFFLYASDFDECSLELKPCDENADCRNTNGSYTCTCKEGYSGDGTICEGNITRLKELSP